MIVGPDNRIELGPVEPGTSENRVNLGFGVNASIRNVAAELQSPLDRASSDARKRRTMTVGVDDLASIMKLDQVQYLNIHKKKRKTSSPGDTKFGSPAICDMQGSLTEDELKLQDSSDEESLKMYFSNYIRAGKDDKMKNMLKVHRMMLLETWYTFQVNIRKIRTEHSKGKYDGKCTTRAISKFYVIEDALNDVNIATIEVSPLHLAILSKQGSCINCILEEIKLIYALNETHEAAYISTLTRFLEAKVTVEFPSDNGILYDDEDRMLDGMNILHLAAKYYPDGLQKIICFAQQDKRIFRIVKDVLLIGKDNQIRNTPLHVAASSSNVSSLRTLLTIGETSINYIDDFVNDYGYTPLHISVETDNKDGTILLLKNDANPNSFGKIPNHHFTPLHLASSKKMVEILLSFDADPFLVSECKETGQKTKATAFQGLLSKNPESALELLNDGVRTNGKTLDSDQLLVILDYGHFKLEATHFKQREYQKLNDLNENSMMFREKECYKDPDELAVHKMILKERCRSLMNHPVLESFLDLKWQLTKPLYWGHLFIYSIFILPITALVLTQTYWLRCDEHTWKNQTDANGSFIDEKLNCICKRVCPDISEYRIMKNDLDDNDCYFRWQHKDQNHVMECHDEHTIEISLLTLSLIGWGFLFLREVLQFFQAWKLYFKSNENWMELLLIIFSGFYLSVFCFNDVNITLKFHLGSWTLFFGWIEVTLLIGRFPLVGALIHMSLQVIKQLLSCLFVFLPVMIAFGLAFHVLLRSNPEFETSIGSVLKVLPLMLGEFEYYENFSWDATSIDKGYVSVQLLFVLSFGFMTIIIMNLLIGLTVTKLDDLLKEAEIIRSEKMVTLIASTQDVLVNSKFPFAAFFNCLKCKKFGHIGQLFPHILAIMSNVEKGKKYHFYKSSHFTRLTHLSLQRISSTKVCFEPNQRNRLYDERSQKIKLDDGGFPVYLYNERNGRKEMALDLILPHKIAGNCLKLIKEKHDQHRKYKERTVEDDMGLHNMKQRMNLQVK